MSIEAKLIDFAEIYGVFMDFYGLCRRGVKIACYQYEPCNSGYIPNSL
jgi:hypothetical protein